MNKPPTESAMDSRARRAAKKAELVAEKSAWRKDSIDNRNGFRIVDPYYNRVIAGVRYDMSAQEVINFCAEKGAR
jgi:hypothetical protein